MPPWHMIGSAPRAFRSAWSAASALAEALVVLRLNHMIHMIMIHDSTKIKLWTWQTSEPPITSNSSNKHQQTAASAATQPPKVRLSRLSLTALIEASKDPTSVSWPWSAPGGAIKAGDTKMFQRQMSIHINTVPNQYQIWSKFKSIYQNMAVDIILIKLKELDGTCNYIRISKKKVAKCKSMTTPKFLLELVEISQAPRTSVADSSCHWSHGSQLQEWLICLSRNVQHSTGRPGPPRRPSIGLPSQNLQIWTKHVQKEKKMDRKWWKLRFQGHLNSAPQRFWEHLRTGPRQQSPHPAFFMFVLQLLSNLETRF